MGLTFGPTPLAEANRVFNELIFGPEELAEGQAYAMYVPFQPHTITPVLGHGQITEPLCDRIRLLIMKLDAAGFVVALSPLYWSDTQWAIPVGHDPIPMGDTALLAETLVCINAVIRAAGFRSP